MAKRWFSIKLYGGMNSADYIDKAIDHATNFVNRHGLGPDEFKMAPFDQTNGRDDVRLAFVVVWYYAENELQSQYSG